MTGPAAAVHDALVFALRALETEAGDRFYAQIQRVRPGYPYGMVWPGVVTPIDEECFDRTEIASQIDIWADPDTYFSVKTIADAIRDAFHEKTIPIEGQVLDRMRIESITFPEAAPNYRAIISVITETQPA